VCPPCADTLFCYKAGRYLNNLFKSKHIIKTITIFANPLNETLDRGSMKHILFLAIALLSLAGCMKEKTTDIRWATFNVRYDNPQDSLNNWQYRKARVCKFIQEQKIDILGMQEVLHNQFLDLRAGLPEYDGIGVGRDDGKTAGEYAPLFYRKDKYEVLDSNTFWLAENSDSVGMMGWDAVCVRIATWAKFREKSTGKIFMAVNTHFDHIGEEARRQSALLIIRKIKEIVGGRPAVVTGDFNVTDASNAYATITTNEFVMKDAYKIADRVTGVDYTFHDFARIPAKDCEKIDFIFVTPQIRVKGCDIPAEVPDALLSDHNPQVADLEF